MSGAFAGMIGVTVVLMISAWRIISFKASVICAWRPALIVPPRAVQNFVVLKTLVWRAVHRHAIFVAQHTPVEIHGVIRVAGVVPETAWASGTEVKHQRGGGDHLLPAQKLTAVFILRPPLCLFHRAAPCATRRGDNHLPQNVRLLAMIYNMLPVWKTRSPAIAGHGAT